MTTLLWTLVVGCLIEVGFSIASLESGKWTERTRGGIIVNMLMMAGFAGWAALLLAGGKA